MPAIQLPDWGSCLWNTTADDGQAVRYRALKGGRGAAKSRTVATALLLKAAQKPLRVLCGREVQKSIRDSVKRLLDDEITRLGLQDVFTSTDSEIRGKNGSLFIFSGLRPTGSASIKSTEGVDICWIEEASTISQTSLDRLIPTIRAPASEIWATWNPDLETDPIDALFCGEAGPPPGTILRTVNYDANPWFPDVLRRELEWDRSRDIDKFQHIWRGEYRRNSEARVFKNWKVEPFDSPSNAVFRFGADWGFSVDPTVLVRCFIGRWEGGQAIADDRGRHLFIDWEAYEVGCEIDKTPALFDTVPDSRAWPITADSARPETISYMRRNGFSKIVPAVKGPNSIEEGVRFLQSFDVMVHPRCQHAIDELTLYSYEVDPLTGSVTPKLADRDNHMIDAARYACEGARRAARAQPPAVIEEPIPMVSPFRRR